MSPLRFRVNINSVYIILITNHCNTISSIVLKQLLFLRLVLLTIIRRHELDVLLFIGKLDSLHWLYDQGRLLLFRFLDR